MAILTRPAIVQKGSPSVFTVNKTDLAAVGAIVDEYYQNELNWKEVVFQLRHSGSAQSISVTFVAGSNTAEFESSHSARAGDWIIEQILLRDYDGGYFQLNRADLPSVELIDFSLTSGAAHGDLHILNGETVQIAAGSDREYGDLIIDSGGTLEILPGGGITTINVTGNCVINGTVKADSGEHSGGSWNKVIFGETLAYAIAQQAGGDGGNGSNVAVPGNEFCGEASILPEDWTDNVPSIHSGQMHFGYTTYHEVSRVLTDLVPGSTYNVQATLYNKAAADPGVRIYADGSLLLTMANGINSTSFVASASSHTLKFVVGAYTVSNAGYQVDTVSVIGDIWKSNAVGGLGVIEGAQTISYGNGGGGAKSHSLTPQDGENALENRGGNGGGGSIGGAVYGNDGEDALLNVKAGAGGARGSHGQALLIRAYKIQGGGTINANGQKGGDGGDGTQTGVPLYAGGGGGAGGSGGKVWLRYQSGTPNLTLNVASGEKGFKGVEHVNITPQAEHGAAGQVGSTDSQTF